MTYRLLRDPVGIRTPNLRIRSAMLYPVELQSRFPDETGGQRYQLVLNRQTVRHNSLFPRVSTTHGLPQLLRQCFLVQHDANGVVAEVGNGNILFAAVVIALAPRVLDDKVLPALGVSGPAYDVHEVVVRILL